MPLLVPYNYLPDLGALEPTDYVPVLRAPFQEGKAFVSDIIYAVQPFTKIVGNITQRTTDDPTFNIFENNTGATITTDYNTVGSYNIISNNAIFTEDYTWILIGNNQASSSINNYIVNRIDDYNLNILTTTGGSSSDGLMNNTSIEIRIYPVPPS